MFLCLDLLIIAGKTSDLKKKNHPNFKKLNQNYFCVNDSDIRFGDAELWD